MSVEAKDLVGNWVTEGTQSGWSSNPTGPSGGWRGTMVLRANGTSSMVFTDGNIAPSRNGDWSLSGTQFSIIDAFGTSWTGYVSSASAIGGDYDAGPAGAAGGTWRARKL